MKTLQPNSAVVPSVATIGFFDGVHRGHRFLAAQVAEAARQRGMRSLLVTFPVHPRKVLQSGFQPQLLTTFREKMELLSQLSVDACLPLEFTPQLAALPAYDFMAMLKRQWGVEALVIGYDHRFGHHRAEGFDSYVAHGRKLGMEVLRAEVLPPDEEGGEAVSSSLVRRLLGDGRVAEAARALGYRYTLCGRVVHGCGVGHTMGFPTANIELPDPDKLIPAHGVYAVSVLLNGDRHAGMLNIGVRPTFGGAGKPSIEVHLFQFVGSLYGEELQVQFVGRIRSEHKFGTVAGLQEQLAADAATARRMTGGCEPFEG